MSSLFGSIMLRHPVVKGSCMGIRTFTSSFVLPCSSSDSSNYSSEVVSKGSMPKVTIAKHPFSLTGAPLRDHAKGDLFAVFQFSGSQYKASVVRSDPKQFFLLMFSSFSSLASSLAQSN